jgi:hypothetical protein
MAEQTVRMTWSVVEQTVRMTWSVAEQTVRKKGGKKIIYIDST